MCACGAEHIAAGQNLRSGDTLSCGCLNQKSSFEKFWGYVEKTDTCWNWKSRTDKDGYGLFNYRYKKWKAHRLAWTLINGPIPEAIDVLHHCDRPICVNAEKCLFLGTNQDNVDDRENKGRGATMKGEDHSQAKLTNEIVVSIR